jgi:hypothetical protein
LIVKPLKMLAVSVGSALLLMLGAPWHELVFSNATAAQFDLAGPVGSGTFGTQVTLLLNGNFVVTDPLFDGPSGTPDVGAVHLYRPDGGLIYTLRGSTANDHVGNAGVYVLNNGHFVIASPDWDSAGVFNAGAATWCNGFNGSNAIVSASNSLVGTTASNRVGSGGVTALTNGNYVVNSYEWDSNTVIDVGAVTWGNGVNGSTGAVSAGNSLVGSSANDQVGIGGATALGNGNYVVNSFYWDNGSIADAGAVTWRSGTGPGNAVVGIGNSLVGSTINDRIGSNRVHALSNGHYVVGSEDWDSGGIVDVGAATWGNGTSGVTGVVSVSNSLVGTTAGDKVSGAVGGGYGIVVLNNGNYVVRSSNWDNGTIIDAGAATWGNGVSGTAGALNPSNSLVGTSAGDMVGGSNIGGGGVIALSNGHYVVHSPLWDNGSVIDAGAATWRDGMSASGTVVSASNSLVGSSANDYVGVVYALSNGHYVVASASWDNGAVNNAGAVTWRDGNSGNGAVVGTSNSLVGSSPNDRVGWSGATALSNGFYVVNSPYWDNAGISDVGAVTWRNGSSGSAGAVVSTSNSLRGSTANDFLGWGGSDALSNGHYVVSSRYWHSGTLVAAGAATWRNGTASSSGTVTASNSLVGGTMNDNVSDSGYDINGVAAQSNGNYVVWSRTWDNSAIVDAGAISVGFGNGTASGLITAANSVRGTLANEGITMNYAYDVLRAQLIVGRPASNIVSLLRPGATTSASIVLDTPDPSDPGEVVTFVITVVASPAPSIGTVRVAADSGETCTDNAPTTTGANTVEFSCQIQFATVGARSVRAEFLGTNSHGYSGSGVELHNVAVLFANEFE